VFDKYPYLHPTLKTASSAPASPALDRTLPAPSEPSAPPSEDRSVHVGEQENDVMTNV